MPQDSPLCMPDEIAGEIWDLGVAGTCNRNYQSCAEPDVFTLSLPATSPMSWRDAGGSTRPSPWLARHMS